MASDSASPRDESKIEDERSALQTFERILEIMPDDRGALEAAILAAQILSIKYPDIAQKLEDMRIKMRQEVERKSAEAEKKYN